MLFLDTRRQTGLFRRGLRHLQSQLGERLALPRLQVGELLPIPFARYRLVLSRLSRALITGACAGGLCGMRGSERGLQRGDAVTIFPFSAQQRELAFLDSFFELDECCFPALAIRG